jgi:hypothetical protein
LTRGFKTDSTIGARDERDFLVRWHVINLLRDRCPAGEGGFRLICLNTFRAAIC